MNDTTVRESGASRSPRRNAFSMRLIVTTATVILVISAVLGVGAVARRNVRRVLTTELQTQLVLESRNLALLSSSALLSDYPELVLHPVIKEMRLDRPDIGMAYVIDHDGVVQGHDDAARLGTLFTMGAGFVPVAGIDLKPSEELLGNTDLIVVKTPILHPNGKKIGTAIVGLQRSHIEALLHEAEKNQGIFLLIILATALFVTSVLISILLRPIDVLRKGLERIGRGNLDTRLELSTRTELGLLAETINDMAGTLKTAQLDLVEKERLDHEMQLAREIQRSLLPNHPTRVADYIIEGAQTAAEEVGGDYYDVFPLNDGRIGIVIADVAGKGLGGCLVTSMIAVLIRTLWPSHASPSALMCAMQASLTDSLRPGTFVTMFYGILDPQTGRITYASAGHNPVFHTVAATGRIERHETTGIPIGLIPGDALAESLEDYELNLASGDVMVQYTDGFSEAVNTSGEEFGLDRIAETAGRVAPEGCHAVVEELQRAIGEWEKGLAAFDDKTLLVISRGEPQPDDANTIPTSATGNDEHIEWLWAQRSDDHQFTMPAELKSLDSIGDWLRNCSCLSDLSTHRFELLEQGLYETCANIVEHGCGFDESRQIDIWWIPCEAHAAGAAGTVHATSATHDACDDRSSNPQTAQGHFLIRDNGAPPNAEEWHQPALDSAKVHRDGRGLGLRLITRIFDDVRIHANTEFGNITIMKFTVLEHQPS